MRISNASLLRMVNQMNYLQQYQSKLCVQLSTGQRINSAADDPVGLAISERMRAQIRGLSQAQRNILDGISLIQTADGSMNEIHSILQRMRELAVQAANGTYNDGDRQKLNEEFQQLKETIDQISSNTEFNQQILTDGSREINEIKLQIGPNSKDKAGIKIGNVSSSGLSIDDLEIATQEGAELAMEKLDDSIKKVSSERGRLGATQNRLEYTLRYLENYEMNLTEAESRIRDVDMAKAIMEYTKTQILLQVSQAIFAQAMKAEKNRVLQLLEGL